MILSVSLRVFFFYSFPKKKFSRVYSEGLDLKRKIYGKIFHASAKDII